MSRRLDKLEARLSRLHQTSMAANAAAGLVAPPASARLAAADIPDFSPGFYRLEHDPSGEAYRWTGSAAFFEIRFVIDRQLPQPLTLRLRPYPPRPVDELKVYVDYIEVPISYERDGDFVLVRATLFAEPLAAATVITVYSPRNVPQSISSDGVDSRTLSLMFYRLEAGLTEAGAMAAGVAATTAANAVPETAEGAASAVGRPPPEATVAAIDHPLPVRKKAGRGTRTPAVALNGTASGAAGAVGVMAQHPDIPCQSPRAGS